MAGRRVVDLGCGFGWFARWARENGAASVLGLDLSDNMLARARAETADSAIRYAKADLDRLVLPPAAFDLAYSTLALYRKSVVKGKSVSVRVDLGGRGIITKKRRDR